MSEQFTIIEYALIILFVISGATLSTVDKVLVNLQKTNKILEKLK